MNRFQPIMAAVQTPPAMKDGKITELHHERLRERVAELEQAVQEAPVREKLAGFQRREAEAGSQ